MKEDPNAEGLVLEIPGASVCLMFFVLPGPTTVDDFDQVSADRGSVPTAGSHRLAFISGTLFVPHVGLASLVSLSQDPWLRWKTTRKG